MRVKAPLLTIALMTIVSAACSTSGDGSNDAASGGGSQKSTNSTGSNGTNTNPLGNGSGSVEMTKIYEGDASLGLVDLEFHPEDPKQLWTISEIDSSLFVITNPGEADSSVKRYQDLSYDHFMRRPPAIAFGDKTYKGDATTKPKYETTWATCENFDRPRELPAGPSLYSSDLEIFVKPTEGDGSHLDMLHSTEFCRGIAHEKANVYWLFNSAEQSLDRYDFAVDHGPGNGDHSDGKIERHVKGQLKGAPGVMSHLEFHVDATSNKGYVYVADTGNKRIVKLSPEGGEKGIPLSCCDGDVIDRYEIEGTKLIDVVPSGTLEAPSGLAIKDDVLVVTDNATSKIHAFRLDGSSLATLDTGLPAGSLAGITFGPDGKVYFVDMLKAAVYRISLKQ